MDARGLTLLYTGGSNGLIGHIRMLDHGDLCALLQNSFTDLTDHVSSRTNLGTGSSLGFGHSQLDMTGYRQIDGTVIGNLLCCFLILKPCGALGANVVTYITDLLTGGLLCRYPGQRYIMLACLCRLLVSADTGLCILMSCGINGNATNGTYVIVLRSIILPGFTGLMSMCRAGLYLDVRGITEITLCGSSTVNGTACIVIGHVIGKGMCYQSGRKLRYQNRSASGATATSPY
jgi:hypothetical protein